MAYVAGFGGGKERGLKMIEEAAAYPGLTQTDAKFALLLLYNRERRFDDAMRVVRDLQKQYPRNRQLWYEAGATLSARRPLSRGRGRCWTRAFDAATPTGASGCLARTRSGTTSAAWRERVRDRRSWREQDFQIPLTREARDWVRGRAHAELGQLAVRTGDREQARREYRLAIELADARKRPGGKAEAECLLRQVR